VPAPLDRPHLAVVTGASAGIGAALARMLSRAGRPVLAVARREDRLVALAAEARASGWAPVHPLAGDVSEEETSIRIAAAAAEHGGAGWLVNNAGFGYHGPFEAQDRARLALLVRLNCEAVVFLTHALLPQLRASGDGVVLNVASAAAFQPTPFMSVYGASKAFVLSFSEGLSEELRGKGVWVGAYCPGPVETEFREVSGGAGRIRRPQVLSADEAAREALDQIARRKVVHVPRPLYRFASTTVRLLPRALVRRISARAQRGVALPRSPE
jgi:short-subunit dehydrogenase